MHDDEQFFSPQALRLLGADNETDLPASQDLLCLFADHSSVMQPHQQRRQPSKPRSVASGLPGTSTFCIASDAERKPKRAKFEPERRMEVAYIRKRGACLRCRIMKLACSGEMPCKACARSSNTCRAREPKYRWMHCVPFSLKEVDIFATYLSITEDVYNEILFHNDRFLTEKVQLLSAGCVIDSLDVNSTALDFFNWLLRADSYQESSSQVAISSMSRTGVISSAQFQFLISNFIGKELSESLRILVETSSVLYNWSMEVYAGYTFSDLERLQSFSGTRVLHYFERALSVKALAHASAEVLQSLFMALTGTILSISYMREGPASFSYASKGSYLNAKQHLVNVLAHYMVYIAESLAFLHDDATKAALIKSAHSQWGHQPQFQWVGWNDVPNTDFNTDLGTNGMSLKSSNALESQSLIIPVEASIGKCKQSSTVGSSSRLLDQCSNCNSALENDGPYEGCSMNPFDNSRRDDDYDGPTEMLGVMKTTSTKVTTPGIGHQHTLWLDEVSTVLQSEMADNKIISRCTCCGVRFPVQFSSSHEGFCEACSLLYNLGRPWPVMDDVLSGDKTLSRTDSQVSGIGVLQGSTIEQAHESIHDKFDIRTNSAQSRNNAITPRVSDNWSNRGGMNSHTPSTSAGQGVMMTLRGRNFVVGSEYFPKRISAQDVMFAPDTLKSVDTEDTLDVFARFTDNTVYGNLKCSDVLLMMNGEREFTKVLDFGSVNNTHFMSHSIVRSDSPSDETNRHRFLV